MPIPFKNNPEWGPEHLQVMEFLRTAEDRKFIHQRELVAACPNLGPHPRYEADLLIAPNNETTARTIRGIINELRNDFRPRIPIISIQGKNGGYRLPVDKKDFAKWWKKSGRKIWHNQIQGWMRTYRSFERRAKQWGNGEDDDQPELGL